MVNKLKKFLPTSSSGVKSWLTLSKIRYISAALLIVIIGVWSPVIAPLLAKKDLNSQFTLDKTENYYDNNTGGFSGGVSLIADLSYVVKEQNGPNANVQSAFLSAAKNDVGSWQSNYSYSVNTDTNQFNNFYGGKIRDGYLYGPVNGQRKSYTFWHPKYDIPLNMVYAEDETVHGINTYKYHAEFSSDVTQQFRDFAQYSGNEDLVSNGAVDVWIEPLTGNIIKYYSNEEVSYYDASTGQKLAPWKIITNQFTADEVAALAVSTESFKNNSTVVHSVIPALLVLTLVAVVAFIVADIFKKHKKLHIDNVSAGLFAAVVLMCLIILYGWLTANLLNVVTNYNVAIMSPPAALLLLGIIAIATVLAYFDSLKMALRIAIALLLIVLISVCSLVLLNIIALDMPKFAAMCFILLSVALLMALLNSQKHFFVIIFKLCLGVAFLLGLASEISIPFRIDVSLISPLLANMETPTALMIALTSIAVYRASYKKAKVNKSIMSMTMRVTVSVVGASIILTGFMWRITQDGIITSGDRKFEDDTNKIISMIDEKIKSQAFAITGGAGLFNASETVTRTEWASYFESLHPVQNIPGIQCIGYGDSFLQSDKDAFEQKLKDDGYGDVSIFPSTDQDQIVAVEYVEPYEACKTAVGYDMYSDATRRAAIEAARDTGMPVMSGKITLIIETEPNPQAGFQMYTPIYKKDATFDTLEHRRESILGYVLGPVRMDDFMRATLGNSVTDIGIQIYDTGSKGDVSESNKMYQSNFDTNLDSSLYHRTVVITEANHDWTIKFGSLAGYTPGNIFDYSLYVLYGGLAASILLGVVTYSLYNSRDRALRLAKKMSRNYKEERNKAISLQKEDDAILANMGEGMLLIDHDGIIRRVNKRATSLLGCDEHELVGRKSSQVIRLADEENKTFHSKNDNATVDVFVSKKIIVYDRLIICNGGDLLPAKITVSPVVIGKKLLGTVVIVSDVTKQYQLDKAKDTFLSLATHQLKTPVTAIKWYVEMLLGQAGSKQQLPPTKQKIAVSIGDCAKHMMYIIDNLLNVSRMETGRLKLDLKHENIKQIVNQAINDFKPQYESKNQEVVLVSAKKIDIVLADRQMISQVFSNLINNAIKYSPNGSKINVCIKQDSKNVIVTVEDQGLGIPKKQQADVFKKFFRADNAIKRESSGSGLGLYLSKAIVKANGGDIKFVSSEDKGAKFTVTLPRHHVGNIEQTTVKINK